MVTALLSGKSLLPAGVTRVEGSFERGDAVVIRGADGREIGRVTNATYRDNHFAASFPRTTCQAIELVITDSHGGSPAIRELGLYDLLK